VSALESCFRRGAQAAHGPVVSIEKTAKLLRSATISRHGARNREGTAGRMDYSMLRRSVARMALCFPLLMGMWPHQNSNSQSCDFGDKSVSRKLRNSILIPLNGSFGYRDCALIAGWSVQESVEFALLDIEVEV
jgi:hypothetical protein